MKNMTLPNIAKAVNGKLYIDGQEIEIASDGRTYTEGRKPVSVTGGYDELMKTEAQNVVIDSRLIAAGGIFVAIKGERTDGHDYIQSVIEKGALGAICEKLPSDYKATGNGIDAEKRGGSLGALILVDDTLIALKKLAAYYRNQIDARIVGIVGSVGKTSTKELVASVLSQSFNTYKTQGNFNNEIGVPLTLFGIRQEHEIAVVEMGISDFGEMDRLGTMVKPDAVIMTNIGPCHLEKLGDLDGVLKAKTEVLKHIKPGGLLILNTDDEKLGYLVSVHNSYQKNSFLHESEHTGEKDLNTWEDGKPGIKIELPIETVEALRGLNIAGYGKNGDVYFSSLKNLGIEGSLFDIMIKKGFLGLNEAEISTKVNMQGSHMVMNALAACMAGLYFGMDLKKIAKGIESAMPVKGRCCPNHTDRFLVVDDSYNANPKSMMAAIDLMAETEGRKVLILGDMFELGENEKELHREVGAYAAEKNPDLLVCVGELSECMYQGFIQAVQNRKDILEEQNRELSGLDSRECSYHSGIDSKALYFKNKEELMSKLDSIDLRDGDIILAKASHGMGFSEVVERLVEKGTRYRFRKGREFMQLDDIMVLLSQTHWACNRSRETVERAIENSLCFGIFDEDGRQVAFGRTVTDYATMFYVSDVVVDMKLHKQGLGRRFVEFIKSAEELKYLWGFLGTTKAKGFYAKCGFEPKDDFFMAMPKTNVKGIFNV